MSTHLSVLGDFFLFKEKTKEFILHTFFTTENWQSPKCQQGYEIDMNFHLQI